MSNHVETFSASSTISPIDAQVSALEKVREFLEQNPKSGSFTVDFYTDKAEGPRTTFFAFYTLNFLNFGGQDD